MENSNNEKILEEINKIKKQQESLKNNIKDITGFVQASFKEQREIEKKTFNELSKNINEQLENYIKDIEKKILKEIENRRKLIRKNNGNSIFKSGNTNSENKNSNNKGNDSSSDIINNIEKDSNEFQNPDNEYNLLNKSIDENKKEYYINILTRDILINLKESDLEQSCINFNITIQNESNEKLPPKTYIEFENKNEKLKFKQPIDELDAKETTNIKCYIIILDKDIKENYESNIIIYNKKSIIKCKPIKLKLVINKKKDLYSINNNDSDNSDSSHNEDDKINVNDNDFQKIMKELKSKKNYEFSAKSKTKINTEIYKHKEDYKKYKEENDEKKKEQLFNNLIQKIVEDFSE